MVETGEFTFKKLEPNQIESYLSKINQNFKKYRNVTIQKWYDKTRLVTGKSFESLEKPIMQQIDHVEKKEAVLFLFSLFINKLINCREKKSC